jgi:hypothetical protein
MVRFIIREGTRQRYQGVFGVIPSVGSFWYNPKGDFTIELTDGVRERNSTRKLEKAMEYFFHGDLIKFKLNDKPNAKGMYEFKAELISKQKQKDLTESNNRASIEEIPPHPIESESTGNDSLGENTSPTSKRSQKTKEVN